MRSDFSLKAFHLQLFPIIDHYQLGAKNTFSFPGGLDPPDIPSAFLTCKSARCSHTMYVCMYGHTSSKSMDQPGKVANPARGQMNRENEYFPVRVRA